MYECKIRLCRNESLETRLKEKCTTICDKVRDKLKPKKPTMYDYPAAVVGCHSKKNPRWCIHTSHRRMDYSSTPALEKELKKLGNIGSKVNDNIVGGCAEPNAAYEVLMNRACNLNTIEFSVALRPRTKQKVKYCKNCKSVFNL